MYSSVKRLVDLILASIAIIVLSPFFLLVFFLLKFTGEGEIFYLQKRVGYKNEIFNIFKFATMLKISPQIGTGMITVRNDPRVTPVGRYLRKSKINELPQIFNVIKGEMSIVGPRPLVEKMFNYYSDDVKEKVYQSKPGITGIGSLVFRDEERLISQSKDIPSVYYEDVIAPYKGLLECWYLEHKSTAVDLVIILLTVWYIIRPNSNMVYRIFPSLPTKPDVLKLNQENL